MSFFLPTTNSVHFFSSRFLVQFSNNAQFVSIVWEAFITLIVSQSTFVSLEMAAAVTGCEENHQQTNTESGLSQKPAKRTICFYWRARRMWTGHWAATTTLTKTMNGHPYDLANQTTFDGIFAHSIRSQSMTMLIKFNFHFSYVRNS